MTIHRRHASLAGVGVFALVIVLASCEDSTKSAGPGTSEAVSEMVAKWKGAELFVSEFAEMDGSKLADGKCAQGTVDGLEVVLCEYPDDDAAKAATEAGLARVAETTGAALSNGKMMLVLADRKKSDPSGRTINRITKLFRGF